MDFISIIGSNGNDDEARDIVLDNNENPIVIGSTNGNNFNITYGSPRESIIGPIDIIIIKLSNDGKNLLYSTFFGGNIEMVHYSRFLSNGNILFCGHIDNNLPVSTGSYQESNGGMFDGFISIMNFSLPPSSPSVIDYSVQKDSIRIKWNEPKSEGGYPIITYNVYRGSSIDELILIDSVGSDKKEYNDDQINNNYEYYYQITASNVIGESQLLSPIFITDTELPQIDNIEMETELLNGDSYTISVSVRDNVGIISVILQYKFTSGTDIIESMEYQGNNDYSKNIYIPNDISGLIEFRIKAVDTLSNTNYSLNQTRTIIDKIPPSVLNDNTNSKGNTGDQFIFKISVIDNIEVESVLVYFEYDDKSHFMILNESDLFWISEITIPDDIFEMKYSFSIVDTSDNWFNTSLKTIEIIDSINPILKKDDSDTIPSNGETYQFRCSFEDNIGIKSVEVEYWYNSKAPISAIMNLSGDQYTYSTTIPSNQTTSLNYRFKAIDLSDNTQVSTDNSLTIIDNILPSVDSIKWISYPENGERSILEIVGSDNIRLKTIIVNYNIDSMDTQSLFYEDLLSIRIETDIPIDSQEFNYEIKLIDQSNNSFKTNPFKIEIKDNISPSIVIEDFYEFNIKEDFIIFLNVSDNREIAKITILSDQNIHITNDSIGGMIEKSGTYLIIVNVSDHAGNSITQEFTIYIVDTSENGDFPVIVIILLIVIVLTCY